MWVLVLIFLVYSDAVTSQKIEGFSSYKSCQNEFKRQIEISNISAYKLTGTCVKVR